MSNRRSILWLLLGNAVLAAALFCASRRAREVASADTRATLCTLPAEEIASLDVADASGAHVALVRGEDGAWSLAAPFAARADAAPVERLLDALTQGALADMRTDDQLAALRETVADFGLARACRTVRLRARGGETVVRFGTNGVARAAGSAAPRDEVYARVEGLRNVFAVPRATFEAVCADVDVYRRRNVFTCAREEIAGIDLRAGGTPPLRLARTPAGWRLAAPGAADAPADETAVAELASHLAAARVERFVYPSSAQPAPAGQTAVPGDVLASYGLVADTGFAVTVRTVEGAAEQIVFGAPADDGTNSVWALVGQGGTVATLPASLAEFCRRRSGELRDTRIFPLAQNTPPETVSIASGALVYVLARGTNGLWRLEAPVVAPADQRAAAALVDCVLRLKSVDVVDAASDAESVRVSVKPAGAAAWPGVAVAPRALAACGALADLRSKTVLALDARSVRRLVRRDAAGRETVLRRTAQNAWAGEGPNARPVPPARVEALLAALARVEAEGVETVAATPEDFRRCRLDAPELSLAADVDAADAVRWNLLLGARAPGGGRYATVGGADAVFILSSKTVDRLSAAWAE